MKKLLFFTATLALAVVSVASAQVDPGNKVEYEWGAAHVVSGQAIVLNLSISDAGGTVAFPVEFEIHDKNGNTLYRNSVMVIPGHSVSLAIGPDVRTSIPADLYAIVGPEFRLLQPCIKVGAPGGGTMPPPESLLVPTLEVMDAATGRVVAFGNNPHAIIGVL
jgi:hypothetical protein